jgi:hypothetical protein
MCSKMGIEVDNMGPMACVQEDMMSTSADVLVEGNDWMMKCSDTTAGNYIQCFTFASYGKTSGACSDISASTSIPESLWEGILSMLAGFVSIFGIEDVAALESCYFNDDESDYVWFPE